MFPGGWMRAGSVRLQFRGRKYPRCECKGAQDSKDTIGLLVCGDGITGAPHRAPPGHYASHRANGIKFSFRPEKCVQASEPSSQLILVKGLTSRRILV